MEPIGLVENTSSILSTMHSLTICQDTLIQQLVIVFPSETVHDCGHVTRNDHEYWHGETVAILVNSKKPVQTREAKVFPSVYNRTYHTNKQPNQQTNT